MAPKGNTDYSPATSLYVSSQDAGTDRLAFFHLLETLKTQKRTGWVNNKIPDAESISDHMYRMSILALTCSDTTLDISKCTLMCVVHDLAEAQVGDIAPSHNVSKEEKRRLEAAAMDNIVHDMLHNSPAAQRIKALWDEYEAGKTPEAKFVKDLDRLEMALQAKEYESRHGMDLQQFFDSSIPKIQHPEVQSWAKDLVNERKGAQETAETT